MSISAACLAFRISQACYRYEAKHQAENDEIADWLLRLTDNNRNWGFGLCFLYLRNVKGCGWNATTRRRPGQASRAARMVASTSVGWWP